MIDLKKKMIENVNLSSEILNGYAAIICTRTSSMSVAEANATAAFASATDSSAGR